jgi:seryl-tRNA synthetase
MDYTGLKKEELIAKLEEQRHLAKAVDAKDAEIAKIIKDRDAEVVKLKEDYQTLKNNLAKDMLKEKEKIAELEKKIAEFPDIKALEEAIKTLEKENKKLVGFANQHINIFKNTLKALQGTLDNAIELEDIVVNGVKEN